MSAVNDHTLAGVIELSKDGEWGKSEPFIDSVAMQVIRGTDFDSVRRGDWSSVPTRYISQKHAELKAIRDGDLLIETAGGSPGRPTGRTIFLRPGSVSGRTLPVTCASFARFIRLDSDLVEPEFVFWWLRYLYECRELLAFQTQHTGVARFQWTTCSQTIVVPRVERALQRKIASILSAYDELIENNDRRPKILEEIVQRLYREWFVDYRYPGHEGIRLVDSELGPIPEGWKVGTLGDLADVNANSIRKVTPDEEIRYIDIASVSQGVVQEPKRMLLSEAPGRARRRVKSGDILWSTVRPNLRAYALMLSSATNVVASTGFAVLSPRFASFSYIYAMTRADAFVDHLIGRATGSAYPAVTPSVFADAPVIIPASGVLQSFADVADQLMQLASQLRTESNNLRTTRDLLLPRLITGDLDVSDLDINLQEVAA